MESGKVKPVDSQPDRSAATHPDDQKRIVKPSHQISSTRCHQDEVPLQGSDSRVNVSDDIGNIRLEEYGIEVQIPPGESYSAEDITVDVIEKVPPELLTVLNEPGAIINVGLKMSPSDESFERPVKVTMPHCGVFQKPESAQIVTYYRKNESAVGETTQSQTIATSQRPVRSSSPGIQLAPGGATSGVPNLQHSSFREGLAGPVLNDTILLDLSKQIDCTAYPVRDFAVDLGFDGVTASAAELVSMQTMDPQRRYTIILDKFVLKNGRGAQNLIDAFKDNNKQLLVDLIIEGKPVRFAAGVNKNPVRLSQTKKLDFKKN
nr:uncharacterized protein LOC129279522 [Lytechinus pictus]